MSMGNQPPRSVPPPVRSVIVVEEDNVQEYSEYNISSKGNPDGTDESHNFNNRKDVTERSQLRQQKQKQQQQSGGGDGEEGKAELERKNVREESEYECPPPVSATKPLLRKIAANNQIKSIELIDS